MRHFTCSGVSLLCLLAHVQLAAGNSCLFLHVQSQHLRSCDCLISRHSQITSLWTCDAHVSSTPHSRPLHPTFEDVTPLRFPGLPAQPGQDSPK